MAKGLQGIQANAKPAWMSLPSFSTAVLFWAQEWRDKDELERMLDARSRIAIRARIRSYWDACDERGTHPEPDFDQVHDSVMSMFREAMRVELIRRDRCDAAFDRAISGIGKPDGKPFLSNIIEMLEAGRVGVKPKLEIVKGRRSRKKSCEESSSHA